MESPSFVSKARTAFHSAAAKAERVLHDLKPDRDSDKQSPRESKKQAEDVESPQNEVVSKSPNEGKQHLRWRPAPIGTKQDWQERFRSIRIGRKGAEDSTTPEKPPETPTMFYDENLYILNMKNDLEAKNAELVPSVEGLNATNNIENIPPTSVMKQLAIAVEAAKKFKSMKDLLASSGDSSPVRERAGLSLSAVKALVIREKEEKNMSGFGSNKKVLSLINALFDAEGDFLRRKIVVTTVTSLPKDIHGAPPDSLVVKLSEVIGSFKTLRKMALFWSKVVAELGRFWSEEQHVPGIPMDEIPDLDSCLLYQQLQVINCCVSRKRRRDIATESLEYVIRKACSNDEESDVSTSMVHTSPILYARTSSGELVLRLGADRPADNVLMLETGEPVYFPIPQEGPLLTEDLIKETEEFVLRTGSVGAGCSQLLSDMQAFKAANPGCILEDFVRWHSPPDWIDTELENEARDSFDGGDVSSTRGQLSSRMQKEGNLWLELWETSKPIPAVRQTPLFDEDLAVEGILHVLEDIPPSGLFEQLFISLLGLGFVMAEATLSSDSNLSKLFYECKDYIIATCQSSTWRQKIDDICQAYETVETILLNPEEVLKTLQQQAEETPTAGEPKRRFKRLGLNFGARKAAPKEQSQEESSARQPFSNFFDGKSSLFSKKPPKPIISPLPADKSPCVDENDWTVV